METGRAREKKIRFWEDTWLGDQSLVSIFPRLYLNSNQKGEIIKNMGG